MFSRVLMDLNAYYDKWAKISNDLEAQDKTLTPDQVKDLKFGVGEPLTEQQFKEHCARNKTSKVIAKHCVQNDAP